MARKIILLVSVSNVYIKHIEWLTCFNLSTSVLACEYADAGCAVAVVDGYDGYSKLTLSNCAALSLASYASPRISSSDAVCIRDCRSSSWTSTDPLYMNSTSRLISENGIPFRITIGCWHGLSLVKTYNIYIILVCTVIWILSHYLLTRHIFSVITR